MKKCVVTIYSRKDCHLCDEAKAAILKSGSRDSFLVEEIDIDADETLKQKYGYDIPVIFINGIKVFKHFVQTEEFERKLKRFTQ